MKITCVYDFLWFTQNDYFLIFEGVLTYDVILRLYINGWYLFWYQWKEEVHSYTLVANLGLYDIQYW